MKKHYELICIGYGPVTREILKFLSGLNILVVSNRCADKFPNVDVVKYSEFVESFRQIPPTNVVVSMRLESLESGFRELLLYDSVLWEYLRKSRIIFLSSVSVYGESLDVKSEENDPCPIDIYASNKVELENLFLNRISAESLLILRIANLYGASEVSLFFDRLESAYTVGLPISIPASKCFRDFVHVSDLCNFIDYWMKLSRDIPHRVLNFGTGVSLSLIDVIQMLNEVGQLNFEVHRNAELPAISTSRIDITRLKESWRCPEIGLDKELLYNLFTPTAHKR